MCTNLAIERGPHIAGFSEVSDLVISPGGRRISPGDHQNSPSFLRQLCDGLRGHGHDLRHVDSGLLKHLEYFTKTMFLFAEWV